MSLNKETKPDTPTTGESEFGSKATKEYSICSRTEALPLNAQGSPILGERGMVLHIYRRYSKCIPRWVGTWNIQVNDIKNIFGLTSPMVRETGVQSCQGLKKWYLIPPCLALSNIRYKTTVSGAIQRKKLCPSLHLGNKVAYFTLFFFI